MSYAVNIASDQMDSPAEKQPIDTPLSKLFRRLLLSIERDLDYSSPMKAYLFVAKYNKALSLYDAYNIDSDMAHDCSIITGRGCYCGSACESREPVVVVYDDGNDAVKCNGIFPEPHIVVPIWHNDSLVGLLNVSLPGIRDNSPYKNNQYPAIFDLVSGYLATEITCDSGINKSDRTGILLNAIDGMLLDLDMDGTVFNIESENNIMDINIGSLIGHRLTNHFINQDKQVIEEALNKLSTGLCNRVKGEYEFKDRYGELHPIELTLYPYVHDDQCDGFSVVCRDINLRKKSETRFYNLLESAPDAVVITDESGKMLTVNEHCTTLFGYDSNELVGEYVEMLLPDQHRVAHKSMREDYSDNPHDRLMSENPNLTARHKSGHLKPVEISLSPFKQGNETLIIAVIRDVTHRKSYEDEFRRLAFVAEHSPNPIIELDASGKIVYANKMASLLSFDVTEGNVYKHFIDKYKNRLPREQSQDILPSNLELGGRIYRQKVRYTQGFDSCFVYFWDVTDGHEISNKLGVKEKTDSLTGLFNRIAFVSSIKDAINKSNITNVSHTILYIDFDEFLDLNQAALPDTVNSDEFLKMVARLLKDNIRQADTLARMQDNKFAILLEYCPVSKGFQVAEKIKATFNGASLDRHEEECGLTASIGVVEIVKSFDSYVEILESAESASLAAKENGKNSIHLYNKKAHMPHISRNASRSQ